ncbi:MAG: alpha/beta hydrolase [Telmatospirillum sp.]|nr:alpha/beta hydrolase [Telmatospirillum sp.]
MRPVLLLVHGWGFDATFWDPLRDALAGPDGIETLAWNLGFRGVPSMPVPPPGRPLVAVGHSLGFLWLLTQCPRETLGRPSNGPWGRPWDRLVAINGFPRFTAASDFPAGVAPRLLDRMIARFDQAPREVYRDFMVRCGSGEPGCDGLDPPRLMEGLRGLRHWDGRGRMAGLGEVSLVLAGTHDPIVPEPMSRAAFPARDIAWHDGGHLLPSQDPVWCAGHLRRLCLTLEEIGPAPAAPGEG